MLISFKKQLAPTLVIFVMFFLLGILVVNILGVNLNTIAISKAAAVAEAFALEPKSEVKTSIKMAFVGDMMLDRGVKNSVYNNLSGDYNKLFSKVKSQLLKYDFLFANLEGPVSNKGIDVGGIYSFRMEPSVIPTLKKAGFDILSVANNHTFNWGEEAFADTLELLSKGGIAYVGGGFDGSKAYKEKIINVRGVKISLLAFSDFRAGGISSESVRPGIALISETEIQKSVSQARKKTDLVVVSYHFGEEYQEEPNAMQKRYAELAVDYGANLVIGSHPHVVQSLEQYKNSYIAYSLGNFIFDQYFSTETMQGGLLEVEVDSESKQIENVILKKVFLNNFFQIESIE